MKYVAVLPSIHEPMTRSFMQTCKMDVMIVDNTVHNRGVPASWNLGIAEMMRRDAEWLVILSAGLRFNENGGLDFIEELKDGRYVVEGGQCYDSPDLGIGWHLLGLPRFLIEEVGTFDENFFPGYWEDNDYSRRIRLWQKEIGVVGEDDGWIKVDVGATLLGANYVPNPQRPQDNPIRVGGIAHGISKGKVFVDNKKLLAYYSSKWGGPPGEETYDLPHGDKPIKFWKRS